MALSQKDWKHVKPLMTPKIAEEMLALEMSADTKKMEKYASARHATRDMRQGGQAGRRD